MKKIVFLIMVLGMVGMVGCDRDEDSTDNPTNPTDSTNPSVGGFDENGASNAVFTVWEGRKVRFSRGNLQYQASTGTWRFAEHQYDCIGNDNVNISSTYSGWIDLFGYATSGWNSGAVCYQPWSTSRNGDDYSNHGIMVNYANSDWGVYNAISNGGNQAGMWRTLTYGEWDYLLKSRAASTINGMANARYAPAVVNGTNGLVIFPDNFTMPSGMSYPSGINNKFSTYISDTLTAPHYDYNTYTESQWSQMEGAGCIFLPAAGYRTGVNNYAVTDVRDVGTMGRYWAAVGDGCGTMNFYEGEVGVSTWYRSNGDGQSVRLVRD